MQPGTVIIDGSRHWAYHAMSSSSSSGGALKLPS
jgi:hypothetical protein